MRGVTFVRSAVRRYELQAANGLTAGQNRYSRNESRVQQVFIATPKTGTGTHVFYDRRKRGHARVPSGIY